MTLSTARLMQTSLDPFGLLVEARGGNADLREVPPERLGEWAQASRVLVLRGFNPLEKDDWVEYCQQWGEILMWNFGAVLDLVVHPDPKNYLFTPGAVPYHWDGAFAKSTPSYLFFQCLQAPTLGSGGETVFCDTTRVHETAPTELQDRWRRISVRYSMEKTAHFGGSVWADLVRTHPKSGARTLRYAEPLDPKDYISPLFLDIAGLPLGQDRAFIADLAERLYQPDVCYAHEWHDGDFVVVDNHATLHARNAFRVDSPRRLQRIHIL